MSSHMGEIHPKRAHTYTTDHFHNIIANLFGLAHAWSN